jgi:hypothetical protein
MAMINELQRHKRLILLGITKDADRHIRFNGILIIVLPHIRDVCRNGGTLRHLFDHAVAVKACLMETFLRANPHSRMPPRQATKADAYNFHHLFHPYLLLIAVIATMNSTAATGGKNTRAAIISFM